MLTTGIIRKINKLGYCEKKEWWSAIFGVDAAEPVITQFLIQLINSEQMADIKTTYANGLKKFTLFPSRYSFKALAGLTISCQKVNGKPLSTCSIEWGISWRKYWASILWVLTGWPHWEQNLPWVIWLQFLHAVVDMLQIYQFFFDGFPAYESGRQGISLQRRRENPI